MLKRFSTRKDKYTDDTDVTPIDPENVPNHVAIIMDGNGRWAKQRGLPRIAGHREGMNVVRKIVRQASRLGLHTLTLYAFSTENWKRPKMEVDFLMKLPDRFLQSELPTLKEENVRVQVMGTLNEIPKHTVDAVQKAVEETKENDGMILNFALNYGSRFEMVEAIKSLYEDVDAGNVKVEDIDENSISDYLMTKDLPDPDLLVRTSGEVRLSNFMLWQLAYAELWFTDVLWPDFTEEHFLEAIRVYQRRTRRYGGV
ncbi:isoprenyl transferase [Texcoconibacillus texcoconensis]|uniref:Isoprenyl transferase n=1 Tax=Texcoconibacillus texcoconensis TaxID=1095777 RepID=A0A840QI64_9BACI|nr:isoprenyl transferase [Texcoconibacillus texcoconensis]MBB5172044.1 undecaprenyl diphosphate synthase [Texcoconibacillus texcoconensis]